MRLRTIGHTPNISTVSTVRKCSRPDAPIGRAAEWPVDRVTVRMHAGWGIRPTAWPCVQCRPDALIGRAVKWPADRVAVRMHDADARRVGHPAYSMAMCSM
ncbi:MAG: hypothetical protein KAU94_03615 [Verrucomicrobia bacterium]|nr:hypothetical protein [Verrucomicrobiota bacterium]